MHSKVSERLLYYVPIDDKIVEIANEQNTTIFKPSGNEKFRHLFLLYRIRPNLRYPE